jgi:hypothetical protein
MTNVPFNPSVGRLSTDRYDFQKHITGVAFRHTADQIDINPPVSILGTNYSTVSTALTELALLSSGAGEGFISVPNGYDTYHNSDTTPNTPYDATVPSLDGFLNSLLNNISNPLHHRIRDGGIVLIPAGTYTIANTVNVPAGITLLGEGFGTKLINQTTAGAPMFQIQAANRIPDSGVDANTQFMFAQETKFFNLVIADNFVEPKFLGDTSYQVPQNTTGPLVQVEEGANFTCDSVKFLGKTTYSGASVVAVSAFPVGLDPSFPVATGTTITIQNCTIDGFSEAVQFHVSCPTFSFFNFRNNGVRVYGMLSGDAVTLPNNCFLNIYSCNANVSNNYCYGDRNNVTALVYLAKSGSNPLVSNLGNYVRILVSNNNALIDRTVSSANTTFRFFTAGASPDGSLMTITGGFNFLSTIVSNNLQDIIGFSAGYSSDPTGNAPLLGVQSDGHATNQLLLNIPTSTSASSGGNGDVPSQVVGYLNVTINGTAYKMPYYNT